MAENDTPEIPEVSLDQFLADSYRLFTIMSVFGAVAVYLTSIADTLSDGPGPTVVNIGIVSSLLLFALVSYVINQRFAATYLDLRFVLLSPALWPKVVGFIFIVFFDLLTLCVVSIVIYYSDGLSVMIGILTFVFAAVITYKLFYYGVVYGTLWLRNAGRDVNWAHSKTVVSVLYLGMLIFSPVYLPRLLMAALPPVFSFQQHLISLDAFIIFGSVIGFLIGLVMTEDTHLDTALESS